jgi:hypothetical protein
LNGFGAASSCRTSKSSTLLRRPAKLRRRAAARCTDVRSSHPRIHWVHCERSRQDRLRDMPANPRGPGRSRKGEARCTLLRGCTVTTRRRRLNPRAEISTTLRCRSWSWAGPSEALSLEERVIAGRVRTSSREIGPDAEDRRSPARSPELPRASFPGRPPAARTTRTLGNVGPRLRLPTRHEHLCPTARKPPTYPGGAEPSNFARSASTRLRFVPRSL